jgi:hypothetical protein
MIWLLLVWLLVSNTILVIVLKKRVFRYTYFRHFFTMSPRRWWDAEINLRQHYADVEFLLEWQKRFYPEKGDVSISELRLAIGHPID